MSVNEKMTILADAVRAKSGATGKLSIDGMTSAVKSITVGSGINTSDATAVSSDILSGKTAYMNGQKITGTMRNCGDFQKELTPADYYASGGSGYYSLVNIQVDTSVRRTFTPSKEKQEYKGTVEGKFLTDVTVEPIPDEYISTEDATASASDISAGATAYVKGELVTGTMEDVTATVDGGTVTIPAGRILEEQTLTVQAGSVTVDRDTVTVTEGYVNEETLTVPAGSVSLDKDTITVAEGYVEEQTLTVPAGSVVINKNINKVIVTEGYVPSQELDLPGGFQLVKVTNYHPAREGMSEPYSVTFSGLGTVESQWGGDPADFSDVNGVFVVTEDTKYKKGLARVYKQDGGKYYLCGYDPSDMDWSEYEAHWYVSETVGGYGYSAKMSYYGFAEIPNGTGNWSNDNIGEFPVTTTVAMRDYPSLNETCLAQSVTAFDPDTAEWTEGDAVDISSYSITPQTNGIYFTQGGKLIGQHIDRELHIPENGLVRRWKAVDGHFVDAVWGTEMLPHGDISYDELGYCGNRAAPMAKTIGSYLETKNTLSTSTEMSFNIFAKPMYTPGRRSVWKIAGEGSDQYGDGLLDFWLFDNNSVRFGALCSGAIDSTIPYNVGKWNMFTITVSFADWIDPKDGVHRMKELHVKAYINGNVAGIHDKVWADSEYGTDFIYVSGNTMRFFANMNNSSESWIGQIDEACIWNRILTDEEIADMAKGLEGFDWDIPGKPYVQKQPVLYFSASDNSGKCESGQSIMTGGGTFNADFWRDGAVWSYYTASDGTYQSNSHQLNNFPSLFNSGKYTLFLQCFYSGLVDDGNYRFNVNKPLLGSELKLNKPTNSYSGTLVCFDVDTGVQLAMDTWVNIALRLTGDFAELFIDGNVVWSQKLTTTPKPFTDSSIGIVNYFFRWGIRNIRLYNRAITDEEVAELSGVKETE